MCVCVCVCVCVAVAPPGFCNRGEVRYGSIASLKLRPYGAIHCRELVISWCAVVWWHDS